MKDELVGFEVAELAKEKGFRFVTNIVYNQKGQSMPCHSVKSWFENVKPPIDAPTQSLLQRWLREVHKLHIRIDTYTADKMTFTIYEINGIVTIKYISGRDINAIASNKSFLTYEKALEEGLKSALELIK